MYITRQNTCPNRLVCLNHGERFRWRFAQKLPAHKPWNLSFSNLLPGTRKNKQLKTPLKTNITVEDPPSSMGNTSTQIVDFPYDMFVFQGVF